MRPAGAYSFFVYSKQACARATTECIGGRMRLFYALDGPAVSDAQERRICDGSCSYMDNEILYV